MNVRVYITVMAVFFMLPANCRAQNPEVPVIDSVTVSSDGNVLITWNLSNPDAVDGFIIKRRIWSFPGVIDGTFNTIVTIDNPQQTMYEDISTVYGEAQPGQRSETYRMLSFRYENDSIIYSNQSTPHSTVHLDTPVFNPCQFATHLAWTPYAGWPEGLNHSEIYMQKESEPYYLFAAITATDTFFIHQNVEANTHYNYFIKTYNSDENKTSTSNEVDVFSYKQVAPGLLNADYATVTGDSTVEVAFTVDLQADVRNYALLRNMENAGTDTVAFFNPAQNPVLYTDTFDNSSQQRSYQLLAVDNCGKILAHSTPVSNTILTAGIHPDGYLQNLLQWNAYRQWSGGVDGYQVYRSVDNQPFLLLATLSAADTTFTDDVSALAEPDAPDVKGIFCYKIKAIEGDSNPYNLKNTAFSNTVCIAQAADIVLPNAFNPHSMVEKNRTFKPQLVFVSDYKMLIFNRFGTTVFETSSAATGWDGRLPSGNYAPTGSYVYYIEFVTPAGELVQQQGVVTLLNNQ